MNNKLFKQTVVCPIFLLVLMNYVLTQTPRIIKLCKYDADCIANAFCKEQKHCECKTDFIYYGIGNNNFACLEKALKLGDPCEQDIQCTFSFGNHAVCNKTVSANSGSCQCITGAHFKENSCYETSYIGGKCKVSNNCNLKSGLPGYCEKSVCVCPNHYHTTEDGTDCIKSVNLDQPCENDLECITENARCGEVCRCKVNYIQGHQNTTCLKAADSMGEPCLENEQCTMFLVKATCGENGTCKCLDGYHYLPPNSKCYRDIGLGEMCDDNAECMVASTECNGGVCRCKPDFQASTDRSQCIGINGQQATKCCATVLFILLILLRLNGYFNLYILN